MKSSPPRLPHPLGVAGVGRCPRDGSSSSVGHAGRISPRSCASTAGCPQRTMRRSLAATATRLTRLLQPSQRDHAVWRRRDECLPSNRSCAGTQVGLDSDRRSLSAKRSRDDQSGSRESDRRGGGWNRMSQRAPRRVVRRGFGDEQVAHQERADTCLRADGGMRTDGAGVTACVRERPPAPPLAMSKSWLLDDEGAASNRSLASPIHQASRRPRRWIELSSNSSQARMR